MAPLDSNQIIQFRKENDIVGYHVYRSTDPDLPKDQWLRLTISPVPDPNFEDNKATPDTEYYYYVTAVSARGVESPPSDVAKAKTPRANI